MKTTDYKTGLNLLIFGAAASILLLTWPARAQDNPETPSSTMEESSDEEGSPADLRISPAFKSPDDDQAEAATGEDTVQADEHQDSPAPRLVGDIPTKIRKVSVAAADSTIAEIMQNVAKQAGVGIVMDPSLGSLQKKMTISLNRKPLTDVLEIVLEAGDLQAAFKGDILFVTAMSAGDPEEDKASFDVRLSADTDSSGALIQITTNKSSRKYGKKSETHHDKNRVQVGKSVHIKADEEVDDAVAIGGTLTVDGKVRGDAAAVGGALNVGPTAHIYGDAVAIGGPLNIEPGAVVDGEQVGIGIPFPVGTIFKDMGNGEVDITLPSILSGIAGGLAAVSFLSVLLRSVLLFVLALVITALAPKRIERIRDYLANQPGYSILAGFVIMMCFVPLIVLLAITLIGIPLIFVVIPALLVLMAFGLASFLTWLGYKIPIFKSRKSQLGAMAIGAVTVMLINLIPVAGPVFLFLVSFVCAGAALLSRLGSEAK